MLRTVLSAAAAAWSSTSLPNVHKSIENMTSPTAVCGPSFLETFGSAFSTVSTSIFFYYFITYPMESFDKIYKFDSVQHDLFSPPRTWLNDCSTWSTIEMFDKESTMSLELWTLINITICQEKSIWTSRNYADLFLKFTSRNHKWSCPLMIYLFEPFQKCWQREIGVRRKTPKFCCIQGTFRRWIYHDKTRSIQILK